MEEQTIQELAKSLYDDYVARKKFQPLRFSGKPVQLGDAYKIQRAVFAHMQSTAEKVGTGGHKIALTSHAIQELCGVNQPVYGKIHPNMIYTSPHKLKLSNFVRLGLEFELAFVLHSDLPIRKEGYCEKSIIDYIDYCMPAFEIIEDRNADYKTLDASSILADRCWCEGVILGSPVYDWKQLPIASLTVKLYKNGILFDNAKTGDAMGNPLTGLAWIANHLQSHGDVLRKGQVVITGSSLKTEFPKNGDIFEFQIEGLGTTKVEVSA